MDYKSSYSRKVTNNKTERVPEWSCPVSTYYPNILLEGQKETTKALRHFSSLFQDLKLSFSIKNKL
jgi:hypothetical protein